MNRPNWGCRAVFIAFFLSWGTAFAQGTPSAVIGGPPAAGTITGIVQPANGGTGVNNGANTLTWGGAVVFSGAFQTTLTVTATTNSTLPAGTHSLAPLDSPVFTTPALGTPSQGVLGSAVTIYNVGTPNGRLTLTSGTPVLATTVSAATTVYYTPYNGNVIPIYDGTAFIATAFTELSNITSNSATGNAGPAAVAASSCYDLFVWNNSGTPTLTRGPVWTNTTSRSAGTALSRTNGILLNSSSITNGPAANRGTYVGTECSNAGSTIDYIFGASSSGGTAAVLNVWNMYNRVSTGTNVIDSETAYTYSSATIRQAGASAGNQITFVIGLQEDSVQPQYGQVGILAAVLSANMQWAMGFDSTTTRSCIQFFVENDAALTTQSTAGSTSCSWSPALGQHFLAALEGGDGTNNNTFNAGTRGNLSAIIRN